MKFYIRLGIWSAAALILGGCRGVPTAGEQTARHDFSMVATQYRPAGQSAGLPVLTADSSLSNFLAYALLNSPSVAAAFNDWSASVENITVTRSLPDPQLTFQAYIQDAITSLMPGLAWNLSGPGKLAARAEVATAASQEKYFLFEGALLQARFNVKQAYYELGRVEEQLRLKREMCQLLENQARVLQAQGTAGTANLTEWLRVQNDLAGVRKELESLEDSRRLALVDFQAALGIAPEQPAPPVPVHFEASPDLADTDSLLHTALEHNPQLAGMAAEVRVAEAGIAVAYKDRVPDFNLALMADVKASPVLFWPQSSMSLPIWRDKLAAEVAQAEAAALAAQSRLKAAQIDVAVNFAGKWFAYRETTRDLRLIENQLMPRADQSLQMVRAGYQAGTMDFSSLISAEQTVLDLKWQIAETRTDREIALAELTLLVAGIPPANTPLPATALQP